MIAVTSVSLTNESIQNVSVGVSINVAVNILAVASPATNVPASVAVNVLVNAPAPVVVIVPGFKTLFSSVNPSSTFSTLQKTKV